MKKSLLAGASISALALATGAQAADLAFKEPPLPASTWTGFYVGGQAGYAVGHSTISNDPASTFAYLSGPVSANGGGIIGGIEAGYNFQFDHVVLGIEGDVSGSSLNRSVAAPAAGPVDTYSSRLDALATLRGRLGWAFDRTLIYGTGGVAFADLQNQLTDTSFPFVATPNAELTGWVAGAGIEYAVAHNWTVKAEYLHVGLPSSSTTVPIFGGYAFDFRNNSQDIGRVGINYKF